MSQQMIKVNLKELIPNLVKIYAKSKVENWNLIPSVMLWGPPGVGKTEGLRGTFINELEKATGKKVNFTDIRMLLFNPVDFRGIPVPDAAREFTLWLKPQIFNLDPSDKVINIVFLDEITAAPQSVQAAAYQLTQDKRVGEHTMPKNTIVMAAGNRVTDKGVANKMATPLADRMQHYEIITDIESWKNWAVNNGISEKIIAYLNYDPSKLYTFNPKGGDDLLFATPRSWSYVSNFVKIFDNDISEAFSQIAATVGIGLAVELKAFDAIFNKLPNINDIWEGKDFTSWFKEAKTKPDVQYAVGGMLLGRWGETSKKGKISQVVKFIRGLSPDLSTKVMKDILLVDGARDKLLQDKNFKEWVKDNKDLIV